MKQPRLFGWLVATILLLAVIGLFYPQQLPVSLYKLSLVTTAGVVGYWLDRSLFPYARPDSFMVEAQGGSCDIDLEDCSPASWKVADGAGFVFAMAMLRRAVIVGCAMMAIGLGA
ncbi:hypothetical protein HCX48_00375 [Rhodocyclus tenuis]|uniref:Phage-related membrane protein n=1 Tax=Rhodocyclus gracilis TaxID=2929842 RepID=A0ABX0WDT7_9RHOO|nr:putative holin [Rhodocyclus gracilis]MRD73315.1 hypothetical protein [Rhodocyclus gracilis]NJA87684.1 hypothetical protein [Rhodocyclus gracilis]